MSLSSQLLHADALVHARHVRCRPHDHACGAAETANANTVAFPLQGVFVKHLDDGRETVAHAGQAVFFNAGESYRVSHPCGGDDCFTLELSEPLLHELLLAHDPRATEKHSSPFRASHALLPASALLHQRLLWRSLCKTRAMLEIEERALELIGDALSATPVQPARRTRARSSTQRRHREQAHATTVLLAMQPERGWTLDELARQVHSSPFHLARTFRCELGSSIHQYLLHLRLTRALDAVLDTDAELTAIALGTGFATPSHFAAAFSSHYGVAPSALRRELSAAAARGLRRISTASADIDHQT